MRKFKPGDHVRIKSGPFASFISVVESVDAAKEVLIAKVQILGRSTPVEMVISEVEKVRPEDVRNPPWASLN